MSLINQEQIFASPASVAKEAFQSGVRIKDVVVVTDHGICKKRQIQLKFVWTDRPFFCLLLYVGAAVFRFPGQHLKNRVIDAVKVSSGAGTDLGSAVRLVKDTDFFLRRKSQGFDAETTGLQPRKCIFCDSPGDGLGGQIEDFVGEMLSQRMDRGKNRGNGFTDPGWGLNKEFLLAENGAVDVYGKLALARTICVGKFQAVDGRIPFRFP